MLPRTEYRRIDEEPRAVRAKGPVGGRNPQTTDSEPIHRQGKVAGSTAFRGPPMRSQNSLDVHVSLDLDIGQVSSPSVRLSQMSQRGNRCRLETQEPGPHLVGGDEVPRGHQQV